MDTKKFTEGTWYPNLNNSKIISFDIESYDPELIDKGPGVYRKDGCVLGVAISNGEFSDYYSFNHKDSPQDKQKNINFITDVLANSVPKVAANIMYDADWLQNGMGIKINGVLHDIQMAEPLICEYRKSFSLAVLSQDYLQLQKETNLLQDWCNENGIKTTNPRAHIYKMSFDLIRQYGKTDAYLPIKILEKQLPILQDQNLSELYRMEMSLIPLLLQMRKVGVRIDNEKVKSKISHLISSLKFKRIHLEKNYGKFNVKSSYQIAQIFDRHGIPYDRHPPTELMQMNGVTQGNPKLDKEALKAIKHPIVDEILSIREFRTILNTFFINSYSEMRVGDRLHALFNPLRSDNYGTVSGRFSGTKPNLQQQPGKEETMGTFCREVFIPEEDHLWGKLDWSQIEYRLIAHYARGEKADYIRERYNNDPTTDYHQMIMDQTGFDRSTAKQLNFAMAYYMGWFACSKKFGWSAQEAKEFIKNYHTEVPFVKETRAHVVKIGKLRGYVRTILNRRARVSPKMIAERKEHSIFNRLIQGSAADLMKKAMVDSYKAGVFNTLIPHLTVHDELDISIPRTKEGKEATLELKNIMETCVKIKVPIMADLEIGPDWGNVSKDQAESFLKEF